MTNISRRWTLFAVACVGGLGLVAVMVLPFATGGYLARKLRMPDHGWKMGLIFWSLAVAVVVIVFSDGPKLGIDLSGGLILIYEVDQDKKDPDKPVDMDKMIAAIKMRVDPSSIKEVTIRPYGAEQIEIIIPEVEADEAQAVEKDLGFKLGKELDQLLEVRQRLREGIGAETLGRFDRAWKRYGRALAPVNDGVCCGCFHRLPTSMNPDSDPKGDPQYCPFCARILYWTPQE